MSPVFCAVANRPSSDPVRREYAATSGVCGDDLLDRAHLPIGFRRARCRPASGSRGRTRLRRPPARSRCRPSRTAPTVAAASSDARRRPRATGRPTITSSSALVERDRSRPCVSPAGRWCADAQRAISGTTLIDSASDISTATDRLSDSARKNWPARPTAGRAARTRRPSSAWS